MSGLEWWSEAVRSWDSVVCEPVGKLWVWDEVALWMSLVFSKNNATPWTLFEHDKAALFFGFAGRGFIDYR